MDELKEEQVVVPNEVTSNEAVAEDVQAEPQEQEVDVFAWANNLVQYIEDLKIDLYLFNKNFTVYSAKMGGDVTMQLKALFVDEILEAVLAGAEDGMIVRSFEEAEAEKGVLQKTEVKKVDKLSYVLNWLKNEKHNIEAFVDSEHDLSRVKGVIAYCHHPRMKSPFFVIKSLPGSQVMRGAQAWKMVPDGTLKPFDDMATIKVPADNQLLVVDTDLFVFNQSKLKSLFGYDAKAAAVAQQKVEEIQAKFRLTFDGISTLQSMVFGKPSTIKKLQKLDVSIVDQASLLAHAEDIGVELMTDESGSIIIVDDKDLVTFVNLLNDDYVESSLTGQKYEILSKRPLKIKDPQ